MYRENQRLGNGRQQFTRGRLRLERHGMDENGIATD